MKRIYVIIDPLITDENSWEIHVASLLQGYVEANSLHNYEIEEIQDLKILKSYFQTSKITSQDKFIFPNAWTSMTTYCKHWSENYHIPVEMIGFWSRGCYINHDIEYRPLNDRNWRKVYERSSFRCLNKSFFISEYHKEQFRIYVSKFVFPERLNVMPFPLEYLSLEASLIKDSFYKQNMIVFPWHKYTTLHEQIMYDFIRVFKDVKIIFAQERLPLERAQMLTQISKSKIAFLPYDAPNIGKEIYECMLVGTIPLIPDLEGFREMVPAEFRYPVEWSDSIFNYAKFAPDLTTKIQDLLINYDKYKVLLSEAGQKAYENYFDSTHIIQEIFGNNS